MTLKERVDVVGCLLWTANGTRLPYGAIAAISCACKVSKQAVRKIWKRILDGEAPSKIVKSKKIGNVQLTTDGLLEMLP